MISKIESHFHCESTKNGRHQLFARMNQKTHKSAIITNIQSTVYDIFRVVGKAISCHQKGLKMFILILFVSAPMIFTGIGIFKNAVNIPTWDDWERGPMLEKYYAGTLDFKYMNGAHIDHRMLFPRLIQLGLNEITHGDLRAEIWATYAIFVMGGVAMFFLVRRTLGKDSAWVWPVAFLINAILFSPLQYQNFLWAVQLAIMIPIACLPVCILVMVSKLSWWKKLALTVPLAIVGTHSFAHGILLWPVVFCLGLLLKEFGSVKQRAAFLTIFGACAATVISAYFLWNFQNVSLHSYGTALGDTPPSGGIAERISENPVKFKRYFMLVLGSPLARIFDTDPMQSAKNVTRGSLVLFGAGIAFMLWRRRDRVDWDKLLPWGAMGMFSICAAFLMASGRCNLSLNRALLPRYVSLTMFLAIAIIGIGAYIFQRWRLRSKDEISGMKRTQVALVFCVAIVGMQFSQWIYGFHKMEAWRYARLQERTSLLYIKHFQPERGGRIDSKLEFPTKHVKFLNEKGLMNPPLFEKPDFGSFTFRKEKLTKGRANIVRADIGSDGKFYMDGYAILPDEERIADGVILAWRPKGIQNGGWQLMSVAEMCGLHVPQASFLDTHFGSNPSFNDPKSYARWRKVLDPSVSPDGTKLIAQHIEIMPFAMDTDRMELHPFDVILEYDSSATSGMERLVIADNDDLVAAPKL